jgi:maleate isomerase
VTVSDIVEPRSGPLAADVVRLGVIALATDLTLEHDFRAMLPRDVRLHVTRIAFANPTTPDNLAAMAPLLSEAADLLVPGVALSAIGFGCTSASVLIGDDIVADRIGAVRPGVPVLTPALAGCRAFEAMGIARISLLTPYLVQTTAPVASYFEAAGLRVDRVHDLGIADDRDIARLSAAAIIDGVRRADDPRADGMFIACTSTPALPLIAALEGELGKPVLCANLALAWAMLTVAGVSGRFPGRLSALSAGVTWS